MTEDRENQEQGSEYTVVGVIDDGEGLNRAVEEIRQLGVSQDDLTVVLRRRNPTEKEPFTAGTRYVVVPGDRRGLEIPIGFSIAFVIFGILFAITTPAIGVPTLFVFVSLATILLAGTFTRVGVDPILTDMEAPREEAGIWNAEFENGKVLIFASTTERRLLRPIRETLQRCGGTFFITDRRMEPRAISQATLHRSGWRGASGEESAMNRATEA